MTDDEAAAKIYAECLRLDPETGEWETPDNEGSHGLADLILIKVLRHLGYEKTAAAWEEVDKWYA